jgi:hypothetical protein
MKIFVGQAQKNCMQFLAEPKEGLLFVNQKYQKLFKLGPAGFNATGPAEQK